MTNDYIKHYKEYMMIAEIKKDLLWKHHHKPSLLFLEEQRKKKKERMENYYKKLMESAKI